LRFNNYKEGFKICIRVPFNILNIFEHLVYFSLSVSSHVDLFNKFAMGKRPRQTHLPCMRNVRQTVCILYGTAVGPSSVTCPCLSAATSPSLGHLHYCVATSWPLTGCQNKQRATQQGSGGGGAVSSAGCFVSLGSFVYLWLRLHPRKCCDWEIIPPSIPIKGSFFHSGWKFTTCIYIHYTVFLCETQIKV